MTFSPATASSSTPVNVTLQTATAGAAIRYTTDGSDPTRTVGSPCVAQPIADSTGVEHTYARWTIPGAPIKWLAEHQGQGFGDPAGAAAYDTFVQSYAPIDHLSLQPYSDPDFDGQGGAAGASHQNLIQLERMLTGPSS